MRVTRTLHWATGRGLTTHLAQRVHRDVKGIDVAQVTLRIIFEIVGDAEPKR